MITITCFTYLDHELIIQIFEWNIKVRSSTKLTIDFSLLPGAVEFAKEAKTNNSFIGGAAVGDICDNRDRFGRSFIK